MLSSIRLGGKPACMVIKGAVDSLVFREYVRKILCPTLHAGDIVICDNLSAHRDIGARKLIEALGARLVFLPAYSPDLNPIEAMWSKVKAFLRAAEARTEKGLWAAIGQALDSVTLRDAQGFFCHCGYLCRIF